MGLTFVIQRRRPDGLFETLWKGYTRPFIGWDQARIAAYLHRKYGPGWYQVYGFERGRYGWIRINIYKGAVSV